MTKKQEFGTDEALSALLRAWNPDGQLPPRFGEAVWNRITSAELVQPRFLRAAIEWVEGMIARPILAASYVALLLFAGACAGYWHAASRIDNARADWRARYVQSVDPYQMHRN